MAKDMAALRARAKEQLRNRTQESYARKDSFGGSGGYFKDGLPAGTLFWWPSEGQHIIDIIPFIAGNNMPTKSGFVAPGDWAIYVDLYIHSNVGPAQEAFICPKLNYGKRCPLCEERDRLRVTENPSEELKKRIQALNVSRRCLYNVLVHDTNKDYERGIQIWDSAHYNFQRHVEVLVEGRDGSIRVFYADPDDGKSIQFTRKGRGQQNTSYLGHALLDRDYIITDEQLEAAHSIDNYLKLCSFEEIQEAFLGGVAKREDTDDIDAPPQSVTSSREKVSTGSPRQAASAPAPTQAEAPAPRTIATRGAKPPEEESFPGPNEASKQEELTAPPPRRRTVPTAEAPAPTPPAREPEAAQPPASAPARRRVGSSPAPTPPPPAEEVDTTTSAVGGTCPAGGVFGKVDSLQDCSTCSIWEECVAESERARKATGAGRRRG